MPSEKELTRRWLLDIERYLAKAQEYVGERGYDAFKADDLRFLAVTRCLEIISEASRRLPVELKERHPEIEWQGMAGAGNIYRHGYDIVSPMRVWETVTDSLSPLHAVVNAELAALDNERDALDRYAGQTMKAPSPEAAPEQVLDEPSATCEPESPDAH